jgi:hypothetical protein
MELPTKDLVFHKERPISNFRKRESFTKEVVSDTEHPIGNQARMPKESNTTTTYLSTVVLAIGLRASHVLMHERPELSSRPNDSSGTNHVIVELRSGDTS